MLSEDLTSRQKSERLMQQLDAVATDPDYWFPFARPFAPVEANPTAEYYFGYGVGPHNAPSLEAVKTWMEGDVRRFDTFTIAEYADYDDARDLEEELESLQQGAGLEAAMNLAEDLATAGGYLDPFRDDPRVFFRDDGPPDPFTTSRQRLLALPDVSEMDTEPFQPLPSDPDAALEGVTWFEATFTHPERELLQPLDEAVNYAIVVRDADPWTGELAVEKVWRLPVGHRGSDSLTLRTFDPDDEAARERAEADRQGLLETYDERGLEGMMHQAELAAMKNGWLDADRTDPRLFHQGPPDRFETLAERLRDEPNPYWNTEGDHPLIPQPGSWNELVAREAEKPLEELPQTPFDRLWHVYDRPVETPDGTPLGHALYLTYYPDVRRDELPDDGFSDADYPTHAKTLEMARFETAGQAQTFAKDFEGYIVPGLLDPPELAEEVAKLEGLPVEWHDLGSQDILGYMSGDGKVVREVEGWRVHDPNAEQAVRYDLEVLDHEIDF
ncbi:MAG: hypothetical protein JNM70_05580 [Anaerolineae bacterium]|nr:hypothetical protein [Anaerolineae bacterium]